MQHVHQPELVQITYDNDPSSYLDSSSLLFLKQVQAAYDLEQDPYIIALRRKQLEGYDTSSAIRKVYTSGQTYCTEQLKTLINKATDMAQELGAVVTEWYLHQCAMQFEKALYMSNLQLVDWSIDEKQHLLAIFKQLPSTGGAIPLMNLSHKVEALIQVLVAQRSLSDDFKGIVFVEQRVWVAILAEILMHHPATKDIFRVGTFIGTSQSGQRKPSIANLFEPRNQQSTLDDFRAGIINLILATSVLEEGIDVSSCNLVVCFERPKNLKSFVQRRGRARKQTSRYFIFIAVSDHTRSAESWKILEAEMRAAYEDDMREVQLAEEREQVDELGARQFHVPKTG